MILRTNQKTNTKLLRPKFQVSITIINIFAWVFSNSKLCFLQYFATHVCETLWRKIGAEDFPLVAPCAFIHVQCIIYNAKYINNLVKHDSENKQKTNTKLCFLFVVSKNKRNANNKRRSVSFLETTGKQQQMLVWFLF